MGLLLPLPPSNRTQHVQDFDGITKFSELTEEKQGNGFLIGLIRLMGLAEGKPPILKIILIILILSKNPLPFPLPKKFR
jgi:hypothetical protein